MDRRQTLTSPDGVGLLEIYGSSVKCDKSDRFKMHGLMLLLLMLLQVRTRSDDAEDWTRLTWRWLPAGLYDSLLLLL